MKFRKVAFITLLAFSLTACGQDTTDEAEEGPKPTAIEIQQAVTESITTTSQLTGKVVASREVNVMSPLPVKVTQLNVKVGDTVQSGSVLFSLDKTDIEDKYQPILDSYARTQRLNDEMIKQAQKNVDNTKALLDIGAASQAQLDQAELALLQQQVNYETQLAQLDDSIKSVNTSLKDATVKAPMTGVVTAVNVIQGADANPQSPAIVIAENQKPQVRVDVSETILPSIKVGGTATVKIPAISEEAFEAKIVSVSPSADPQTQLYAVKLDISATRGYVVGMFADVVFTTQSKDNAVVIPSDAILTDGEISYVFVSNSDNTASKVEVVTGLIAGEKTEITSGLVGGENVIVKGQNYVSEGSLVKVTGGN